MVVDRHGRLHYPAGSPESRGGEYAPKWVTAVSARLGRRGRTRIVRRSEDYRGGHQPPEPGADPNTVVMRMDDLEMDMPGVYEHPDWYLSRETEGYREAVRVLRATRGNPDATVTIYRGAPSAARKIRSGDWVTTSRAYAEAHGRDPEDPEKDWPVLSMQVPVRHVYWGGNDFIEFGYWPRAAKPEQPSTSPEWPAAFAERMRARYPGLMLDLHRDPSGYVVLPRIVVPERRRGTGTAIMQELIDEADRQGDTLALTPSTSFGGSKAGLDRFYRRFGFVPNRGRNKDFTTRETMIRRPR